MLSFFKTLIPCLIYGLCWFVAVDHALPGFLLLLLTGFIIGIIFNHENLLLNIIIFVTITTVMGLLAAFVPVIGDIFDAAMVLFLTLSKSRIIRHNFLLIIIGVAVYTALFFGPAFIHQKLASGSPAGYYYWADFFTGTGIMLLISLLLKQLEYKVSRTFAFTLGLPGFLFLFHSRKAIIKPYKG